MKCIYIINDDPTKRLRVAEWVSRRTPPRPTDGDIQKPVQERVVREVKCTVLRIINDDGSTYFNFTGNMLDIFGNASWKRTAVRMRLIQQSLNPILRN